MEDNPLSTSPVNLLPESPLISHASSVHPPLSIPPAPDAQPLHIPTHWQGRHGVGLLQPALLPSSSAPSAVHRGLLQGAHRPNSHRVRSRTHTPYSTYNAPSSSNESFPETNPHSRLCGWRSEDDSECGGVVTRQTVSQHLAAWHGIRKKASHERITCRWCPDGTDPIKRESIARHLREVHLRLRRNATI
jgi:hypothetical protein